MYHASQVGHLQASLDVEQARPVIEVVLHSPLGPCRLDGVIFYVIVNLSAC